MATTPPSSTPGIWNIQVIGTPKGMLVTGIVLKKPATPLGPEGKWWATLKKTIRTYFLNPFGGQFIIRTKLRDYTVKTNRHGGFEAQLEEGFDADLQFMNARGNQALSLLHTYPHNFNYTAEKLMVISDIDDTILVSKSSQFFSKLWLMLFRQTDRRNFVEETEHAYRQLKNHLPFVYVSASEYNLYSIITNFLVYHELPLGPVLLRPFQRWNKVFDRTSRRDYKINRITMLLEQFPHTRFVLFGDDSQDDPWVYSEMMRKYPDQVHSAYLRKTGFDSDEKSAKKLAHFTDHSVVYAYDHFDEIKSPINTLIHEVAIGR